MAAMSHSATVTTVRDDQGEHCVVQQDTERWQRPIVRPEDPAETDRWERDKQRIDNAMPKPPPDKTVPRRRWWHRYTRRTR